MSISRPAAVTVGAAISAAAILTFFFHAPPIPVAIGVVAAVTIILMRRPRM
jgi:uncharacterized membrane protein YgaE (UPF0421/DUF939 family)